MKLSKAVVGFVLVLFGAGCATTSNDRLWGALEELQKSETQDHLLSENDGLTKDGCRVFFPDQDASACIKKWSSLDFVGRKTFLLTEASPTIRGVWEEARLRGISQAVQKSRGDVKIPLASIRQELQKNGDELLRSCVQDASGRGDEDSCLFGFTQLATEAEVRKALSEADALATEVELNRRRSLQNAFLLRTMQTPSYLRSPAAIRLPNGTVIRR